MERLLFISLSLGLTHKLSHREWARILKSGPDPKNWSKLQTLTSKIMKILLRGLLTLKASNSGKPLPSSPGIWNSDLPRAAPAWVTRNMLLFLWPLWLLKASTAPSKWKKRRWWWRCREPSFPFLAELPTGVQSCTLFASFPAPSMASGTGCRFCTSAICSPASAQGCSKPVSNRMMSDLRYIPSCSLSDDE